MRDKVLKFRIDKELEEWLNGLKEETGLTVSKIIRILIEDYRKYFEFKRGKGGDLLNN
ncbi:ribbon-helix-helix protein, CopG family [Thermophagus sp. OGC60D27]|uniref:ribbon-helix-helix protein, CopG family n=1 Tax=Thermophagus sp. OGC60D27 TaxID=3458415 RepID=UPI004037D2B6